MFKFKKFIGATVIGAALAAIGIKVVKDVLNADEEEKNIIDLEKEACVKPEEPCEETHVEE
ncbi:MAG: hypothetical protein QM204_00380 [Bacillota bacterium]|jgi:hypothetical protein|nr:hypothetical protein [Bacillota bacterium]NLL26163.1 hypothetical protein [Erysipelotrichia bacterium]